MKQFFRSASNWVMLSLILALSVALVCTSVGLAKREEAIGAVSEQEQTRAEKIAEMNAKIEELGATVSDLTAQLGAKTDELQEANSTLDTEKNEKAALKKQTESLKKQIQDLKKQIADLQAQIDRLKLSKANTGSKVCYLTFDDGPSDNTLKILKILEEADAKATFFVLGTGKLDYLKNIAEGGHSIGLHGDNHVYKAIYASEDAFFASMQCLHDKVKDRTGIDTALIRFPGGSSNAVSKKICPGIMTRLTKSVKEKGYCYFDWNVSSSDATSKPVSAAQMIEIVKSTSNGKNNICVLMHDAAGKTTTVEALPGMINALREMGYRFEALTVDSYNFAHGHLNN